MKSNETLTVITSGQGTTTYVSSHICTQKNELSYSKTLGSNGEYVSYETETIKLDYSPSSWHLTILKDAYVNGAYKSKGTVYTWGYNYSVEYIIISK